MNKWIIRVKNEDYEEIKEYIQSLVGHPDWPCKTWYPVYPTNYGKLTDIHCVNIKYEIKVLIKLKFNITEYT